MHTWVTPGGVRVTSDVARDESRTRAHAAVAAWRYAWVKYVLGRDPAG